MFGGWLVRVGTNPAAMALTFFVADEGRWDGEDFGVEDYEDDEEEEYDEDEEGEEEDEDEEEYEEEDEEEEAESPERFDPCFALASTSCMYSIRRATVDDAPTLSALAARTFTETFGHLYRRRTCRPSWRRPTRSSASA